MASVIGFDNPNNTTNVFNTNHGGSIDPTSDIECNSVTCNDITANNEVILNTVDVKDSVITINSGNPSNNVSGALLFESNQGNIYHSGLCRGTDGTHYLITDTSTTINGATDVSALTRGNLTLNRVTAYEEYVTSSNADYGNIKYLNATGDNTDPVAHYLGGISGVNIGEGPLTVAGGLTVSGGTSWFNGVGGVGIEAGLNLGSFGGVLTQWDLTDSTDATTGSITTGGGVGVAKSMNIGGTVKILDSSHSSDSASGALVVTGGVGIGKTMYSNMVITRFGSFLDTRESTALYTGGLLVAGGTSIAKNLYLGGAENIGSVTDSNATNTGALVVQGGASVNKTFRVGGACVVNDYISSNKTSDATDSLSGSLILVGGAGISKKVYVGDGIYLPSSGGTASKLNYYEELTHTTNYTGAVSISNVSFKITRVGNVVYITIPYATANAGSTTNQFTTDTAIPSRFRPSTGKYFYCEVNNNASAVRGYCNLSNGGTFTFYKWDGTNFVIGNYAGTYSTGISYVLD